MSVRRSNADRGDPVPAWVRGCLNKITYGPDEDCWGWIGAVGDKGKGYRPIANGPTGAAETATRTVWRLFYGPVPTGWDIHHRCGNAKCVNPWHLQAIDARRHDALHAGPPEVCKHGHRLDPRNLGVYADGKGWFCRECSRIRSRAHYNRTHNRG